MSNSPVDFDHDNLVSPTGGYLVRWGNEGYLVDPGFAEPSKGDYRLSPNSQLIDAGILVLGINDDFRGRAPDIGAFEFHSR